ncbi:hypothetical protein DPMN_049502 [Dreissena polymorpha]|uniref:Uncharacterized protein n=1 Tax=Dreissena polymorpha TaxID=45954 RepID=A0A9D4CEG8_DREPO|nr:hypothetical protein DPMN_049502 [Dreissena polymorpha]
MRGAIETVTVTYSAPYLPPFDPRGIACDKNGPVIVCDYNSNMVHLLDKNGRLLMYLLTEADGILRLIAPGTYGWAVKIYKFIDFDNI